MEWVDKMAEEMQYGPEGQVTKVYVELAEKVP